MYQATTNGEMIKTKSTEIDVEEHTRKGSLRHIANKMHAWNGINQTAFNKPRNVCILPRPPRPAEGDIIIGDACARDDDDDDDEREAEEIGVRSPRRADAPAEPGRTSVYLLLEVWGRVCVRESV
jgi:hypothetical protein